MSVMPDREPAPLRFLPLTGIPVVEAGDDLAGLIRAAAKRVHQELVGGILVVVLIVWVFTRLNKKVNG